MSGIPTKRYGSDSINADKFTDEIREYGYAYYNGRVQPTVSTANGYSDPTGTTGDINRAIFHGGLGPLTSVYHVKGTQTLLAPLLDTAEGLDVSQDQTDNDGVEHVFGTLGVRGPYAWTVGTHNGFVEIDFEIADVSGTDDCALGFRKQEAFQANIDDYDEAAFINVILGDVKVETILNGGTTTTTDSGENWTDGETHTLRVDLKGRLVEYRLDGEELPGIPDFSFDSGEVVVPFFFFLQATTTPGKVFWKHVRVGRQKAISTDGNGN